MFRIIILVLIIAGVAAYFTRPQAPAMEAAANEVLSSPGNLEQGLQGIGAAVAGNRAFTDYFVATRYVVTLNDRVLVTCWGAFQQTQCDRPAAS